MYIKHLHCNFILHMFNNYYQNQLRLQNYGFVVNYSRPML